MAAAPLSTLVTAAPDGRRDIVEHGEQEGKRLEVGHSYFVVMAGTPTGYQDGTINFDGCATVPDSLYGVV
jgi:hypothetical protein